MLQPPGNGGRIENSDLEGTPVEDSKCAPQLDSGTEGDGGTEVESSRLLVVPIFRGGSSFREFYRTIQRYTWA